MPEQAPQEYHSIRDQNTFPATVAPNGAMHQPDVKVRPVEEVERVLIKDTSRLILALDDTLDEDILIDKQLPYLEGERRYEGPCEAAIYLDKSARPVRALVKEFWDKFSEEEIPKASFLNIDKMNYLLIMGFTPTETKRLIAPEEIDVQKIDERTLKIRTAQIRALYVTDRSRLPEIEELLLAAENDEAPLEALDMIWELPTHLDGKHVGIVDEVKSSGATLMIADQLLALSFPDARLEPLFWSMPMTFQSEKVIDGKTVTFMNDTEKPLWYDGGTSRGRGGIGNANTEKARESGNIAARIGAYVLSRPFKEENKSIDSQGFGYRKDFKILRRRYDEGKIPSTGDFKRRDS